MRTSIQTIDDLIESRGETAGASIVFWKEDGPRWLPVTAGEFCEQKRALANAFFQRGLKKGDVVGIISSARYEWELAEKAVLSIGGLSFGIDANLAESEIEASLKASSAGFAIVENDAVYQKLPPEYKLTAVFFDTAHSENKTVSDLIAQSSKSAPHVALSADDFAIIIGTSGTTGKPKLIRYRHSQLITATYQTAAALNVSTSSPVKEKVTVCWLPLAYMTSKIINLICYAVHGELYFCSNPKRIMEVMLLINPSQMIAVPIFFERVYVGIIERLRQVSLLQQWTFFAILFLRQRGAKWIGSQVVRQIREKIFGKNILYLLSGTAPLRMKLLKFFEGLDVMVLEGYALSENAIPVAMNTPLVFKMGTVGKPLPGTQLKFAPDDEILVKGPGVFEGYWGDTQESHSLDSEGYLHTGDLGCLDKDGFLSITGRKKEMIKTANGYRISPVEVEGAYQQIPYIRQIVVVGDQQKYLGALIVLEPEAVLSWCRQAGVKVQEDQVYNSAEIRKLIEAEIARISESVAHYKRVKTFVLLKENLSLAHGELTPNLKLRRDVIKQHYEKEIEKMFTGDGGFAK